MGFFDFLGGGGGKPASAGAPYKVETKFNPMRMNARREASVDLVIELTNVSGEKALASVLVAVPKALGVDSTCINKKKEVRIGEIAPNEKKAVVVQVYGNSLTQPGEHVVGIVAYSHYRDYKHVLNSMKKTIGMRTV